MNKNFYLLFLILIFSCKNDTQDKNSVVLSDTSQKVTTYKQEEKIPIGKIDWIEKSFKNFNFEIPENWNLQASVSNYNKQVFLNSSDNIALTIDIGEIPEGYEDSNINNLITNQSQFANAINQNQKRNFQDFELIGYKFGTLGNTDSFIINQVSNDVSGIKNITMKVKSHFILSKPYYCSITFTYPQNSDNAPTLITKVENFFTFPKPKEIITTENKTSYEKKNEESVKSNIDRPSEYETKKWILSKFKAYADPDFNYKMDKNKLIITTSNNPETAIEYTIPLCDARVSKYTFHSYSNERIKFYISNGGRIKIDRNWKGFPKFESSFDFQFQYSSEDNLITRLNDAIENLKYYCPDIKSSSEAF
jgi:hypothetical protein